MGQRDVNQQGEASLAERLRERIRREGAITFHDWMQAALYDEREGYYCRTDLPRWGRTGDYRTSPERSPLFASTFAGYFASLYAELCAPKLFRIIEAGAGAGDFARGVLETLQRWYGEVYAATHYVVDEASEDARRRGERELAPFAEHVEYQSLCEMEEASVEGIIFANELLDAFPVHRVRMHEGRLLELYVGLDKTGAFCWIEREPSTPRLGAHFARQGISLREGQTAEVNLDAEEWIARAASVLKRGYLITVDYGAEAAELYQATHRREGTLRAFHRHQFADDTLARPGEQDLTTTVDWTHLRRVSEEAGLRAISFERQDEFLLRTGLLEQMERRVAELHGTAEALALRASARPLILPGEMSESFQVLVQKVLKQ